MRRRHKSSVHWHLQKGHRLYAPLGRVKMEGSPTQLCLASLLGALPMKQWVADREVACLVVCRMVGGKVLAVPHSHSLCSLCSSTDGGNEDSSEHSLANVDSRLNRTGQGGSSTESDCAFEGDCALPEGMQHIRIMEGMSRSLPSSPLLAHQAISVRLQPMKKLTGVKLQSDLGWPKELLSLLEGDEARLVSYQSPTECVVWYENGTGDYQLQRNVSPVAECSKACLKEQAVLRVERERERELDRQYCDGRWRGL
ncbi:UNVERIFIED_CONTAM: hypothetical protein FKN15_047954 [Acipenser sinensis]